MKRLVLLFALTALTAAQSPGTLEVFGRNTDGDLGTGVSGAPVQTPELQTAFAGNGFDVPLMHLSAADGRVLAITEDGDVYAWGDNTEGALGTGSENADESSPARVAVLSGVDALWTATGNDASFFINQEDASLYGWGSGTFGLVGSNVSSPIPTPVGGQLVGVNCRRIYAHGNHALAVTVNGHVYSWGDDTYGQLGNGPGETGTVYSPRLMLEFLNNNYLAVGFGAVGLDHSVAIAGGVLYTWGRGDEYQTAQGATGDLDVPTEVTTFSPAPSGDDYVFIDVVCGDHHCLAMEVGGDIFSWGRGDVGAPGQGSIADVQIPTLLARVGTGSPAWAAMAAGADHSVLINDLGDVYVTGSGDSYQTGLGDTDNELSPVPVTLADSADVSESVLAAGLRSTFLYHPPVSCLGACANGRCDVGGECLCSAGWAGDACDELIGGVSGETPTSTVFVTVAIVLGVVALIAAAIAYVVREKWLRENQLELDRIAKYQKLKRDKEAQEKA